MSTYKFWISPGKIPTFGWNLWTLCWDFLPPLSYPGRHKKLPVPWSCGLRQSNNLLSAQPPSLPWQWGKQLRQAKPFPHHKAMLGLFEGNTVTVKTAFILGCFKSITCKEKRKGCSTNWKRERCFLKINKINKIKQDTKPIQSITVKLLPSIHKSHQTRQEQRDKEKKNT